MWRYAHALQTHTYADTHIHTCTLWAEGCPPQLPVPKRKERKNKTLGFWISDKSEFIRNGDAGVQPGLPLRTPTAPKA